MSGSTYFMRISVIMYGVVHTHYYIRYALLYKTFITLLTTVVISHMVNLQLL